MTKTSNSRPSKYIVTGGAGFIGSHITDYLLPRNQVIVIDNFSAGKKENLPEHENLHVFDIDVCDWITLASQLSNDLFKNVDGVFHLAADARIQPSISDPRQTFFANALGTFNVLEFMRFGNIKRIVYSASSSSYGRKNKSPLKESMHADCLNAYAATKLIGETLCKTYGNSYDIENVCLKYFNVYGPRSPIDLKTYSPVIGLFFKQALQDKTALTVVGDGTQKRDFTYISDVVEANARAMHNLIISGKKSPAYGETLNIGTGSNYTILEIANKIKDLLSDINPDIEIKHISPRPGEALETLADISLARKTLHWSPSTSLDQALKILKTYYKHVFDIA